LMHTGMSVESPVLSNGHAGFGGAGRGNGSPETATPRPGPTLHLPLSRTDANMVFQLVARRYERGSILATSNKAFSEWGQVFGDDVLASAILDRLLHHCDVISINGPSDRLKDRLKPSPNGGGALE
jgi:IstB-like ATP binding protein